MDFIKPKEGQRSGVWKSNFRNEKSRHSQTILNHNFNRRISILTVSSESTSSLNSNSNFNSNLSLSNPKNNKNFGNTFGHCFHIKANLIDFIKHFISSKYLEIFPKNVLVVGVNTHLDTDNSFCIHSSKLIMSMSNENYERFGIEGEKSTLRNLRKIRRFVKVDLSKKEIEKENFSESLARQFSDVEFIVKVNGEDDAKMIKSKFKKEARELEANMKGEMINVKFPLLNSDIMKTAFGEEKEVFTNSESEILEELFSLIGVLSNDFSSDILKNEELNDLWPILKSKNLFIPSQIEKIIYEGFFSPSEVLNLFNSHRKSINEIQSTKEEKNHYLIFNVTGFEDSPVVWGENEHGYDVNGDCGYTFILLDNENYLQFTYFSNNDTHFQ